MKSNRAFFSTALASIATISLLACGQSLTNAASQPSSQSSSQPSNQLSQPQTATLTPIPKSLDSSAAGNKSDHNFSACLQIVAYDPEDSSVNLRDRPDGTVTARLSNLTILETGEPAGADPGWNRVYAVDRAIWGYVWGDLIYRTYYQVQDTSANLRRSPNGAAIASIRNGTEVRFLGISGTWTKVALDSGQAGYIATSLLTDPDCF